MITNTPHYLTGRYVTHQQDGVHIETHCTSRVKFGGEDDSKRGQYPPCQKITLQNISVGWMHPVKRNLFITILLLSVIVIAANGCTNKSIIGARATSTTMPIAVSQISSQIVASSIQELTHYSDVVVIGQIVSKEKVINTARDSNDLTKPDTRFYNINQVYKVEIEKVIKGAELKSLLLVQNQGCLTLTPGIELSKAEIESEIQRNEQKVFIPLSLDKRYLFFLRLLDKTHYDLNGYSSSGLYAGALEPWLFEITDTGIVIPETLVSGIEEIFPSGDLDTVLEAISQPYVPGKVNNP